MSQEEEERQREILEAQIARARAQAADESGPAEGTELKRDENGQPLQIALAAVPKPVQRGGPAKLAQGFGVGDRGGKVRLMSSLAALSSWIP